MSQGAALEDELSSSCRQALEHLRERRPEADVIAVHGDWAYISVGEIDIAAATDVFERETAEGIVRVPTNFPCNTAPYGLITVPYLERSDGQSISKQERSHAKAEAVEEALGTDDIGFWSWRWNQISSSNPSDLKVAPDMFRERLRME